MNRPMYWACDSGASARATSASQLDSTKSPVDVIQLRSTTSAAMPTRYRLRAITAIPPSQGPARPQESVPADACGLSEASGMLGRTRSPILSAADEYREGYVPNVVYTCGAICLGDNLFVPYGVADSAVCFAFFSVKQMVASMSRNWRS